MAEVNWTERIMAMMFDRLLGFIDRSNRTSTNWRDPNSDVRLATAVILYSVVPADFQNLPQEGTALFGELNLLFNIGPRKTRKLIARAAAAKSAEPSIFASALLLQRKTNFSFRQKVIDSLLVVAWADGHFHANERELVQRTTRLLGLQSVEAFELISDQPTDIAA
jgi:uncharacterized tellurite resistance protein B-like protein